MNIDDYKSIAAKEAVKLVKNDMVIGLGTGSTTMYFLLELARLVENGLNVKCVSSSISTEMRSEKLGIKLYHPKLFSKLDLYVDGADEIDANLIAIKGGGGAMLREKILADMANNTVVIADYSKYKSKLGDFPLPVEIHPFALKSALHDLHETLKIFLQKDIKIAQRKNENMDYVTDNGNFIVDIFCEQIDDANKLNNFLLSKSYILATGLFINEIDQAIIVGPNGIRYLDRDENIDYGKI